MEVRRSWPLSPTWTAAVPAADVPASAVRRSRAFLASAVRETPRQPAETPAVRSRKRPAFPPAFIACDERGNYECAAWSPMRIP
jgi:hypothetical protein